jgi:hypothetical protein
MNAIAFGIAREVTGFGIRQSAPMRRMPIAAVIVVLASGCSGGGTTSPTKVRGCRR